MKRAAPDPGSAPAFDFPGLPPDVQRLIHRLIQARAANRDMTTDGFLPPANEKEEEAMVEERTAWLFTLANLEDASKATRAVLAVPPRKRVLGNRVGYYQCILRSGDAAYVEATVAGLLHDARLGGPRANDAIHDYYPAFFEACGRELWAFDRIQEMIELMHFTKTNPGLTMRIEQRLYVRSLYILGLLRSHRRADPLRESFLKQAMGAYRRDPCPTRHRSPLHLAATAVQADDVHWLRACLSQMTQNDALHRYSSLLRTAAEADAPNALQFLCESKPHKAVKNASLLITRAIACGRIANLRYLCPRHGPLQWTPDPRMHEPDMPLVFRALYYGQPALADWLVTSPANEAGDCQPQPLPTAEERTAFLEFLARPGRREQKSVRYLVLALDWVVRRMGALTTAEVHAFFENLIVHDNTEPFIHWLLLGSPERRAQWPADVLDRALAAGKTTVIDRILQLPQPLPGPVGLSTGVLCQALNSAIFEAYQYHELEEDIDFDTPDLVQWACTRGHLRHLSGRFCALAVSCGNLTVLRQLRAAGVPWDTDGLAAIVLSFPFLPNGWASKEFMRYEHTRTKMRAALIELGYPLRPGEWVIMAESAMDAGALQQWTAAGYSIPPGELAAMRTLAATRTLGTGIAEWIGRQRAGGH